jgi:hypothetical protein
VYRESCLVFGGVSSPEYTECIEGSAECRLQAVNNSVDVMPCPKATFVQARAQG